MAKRKHPTPVLPDENPTDFEAQRQARCAKVDGLV